MDLLDGRIVGHRIDGGGDHLSTAAPSIAEPGVLPGASGQIGYPIIVVHLKLITLHFANKVY